ncbi:MAG: hypothetical protein HYV33_02970 [Candidatus Kerfeldbacteria bacterium]|nr:hypothetical protein [Candidatus Kerfeldbacteria bacterium]
MKQSATALLLKNKKQFYQTIFQPNRWNRLAAELMAVSLLGLASFGLVMGSYIPHWRWPLGLSWKMIVLLWGSVALCTPALFVFSAIRGSRITLPQLVYLLIGGLATSGIVVLALAPISWFFTWTDTSPGHLILRLMNGGMIAVSLLFGLYLIGQGLYAVHQQVKATTPESKAALDIVVIWLVLLIVVIAQMSAKLGPWYQ